MPKTFQVKHINKQSKHRQSLYSIEFGASSDTIRHRGDVMLGYGDHDPHDQDGGELSPKPMTPRRVKRRSVMARGSHGRQSSGGSSSTRRSHHGSSNTLRSKHGGAGGHAADSSSGSYVRSSTRSSRRKYHQNPVTKLLDQQQQLQLHHQQQQQQQQQLHQQQYQQPQLGSFHRQEKRPLTATNLQSLNDDIVNNSNNVAGQLGSLGKSNSHYYHSYRKNIPLDPIYYNTNGQGMLFAAGNMEEQASPPLPPPPPAPLVGLQNSAGGGGGGHYNPSYQHSTTQLNDVGHASDELYNNRPPSVRSSYSNFHGSRPLSTAYNTTENVFAGLSGASASPPQPPCTPPLYQQHPIHQQQQQQQYLPPPVPEPAPSYVSAQSHGHMSFSKRTASRESIRSMAFLNNGPPAYNLNYHTPPDSETTM
ncbi:GH19906 [Drosophila grimshawi]|uniref:GH19906 n=1 Tax=Drosophila grimshawi TaxID=7222 RepID=B4J938_DROGR|nr:GH19906 [Drosophila grimshawi]